VGWLSANAISLQLIVLRVIFSENPFPLFGSRASAFVLVNRLSNHFPQASSSILAVEGKPASWRLAAMAVLPCATIHLATQRGRARANAKVTK
jgi:hypothetical protein